MVNVLEIQNLIENNYPEIVSRVDVVHSNQLRVYLIDSSYLDIWFSLKLLNRYSYHWERKNIDGTIYRHDNAPHLKWKNILTFPKHFHNKTEDNVEESHISDIPQKAVKEMLNFIKNNIKR